MNKPTASAAVTLSHVAEHARRYPGETVAFFTRIDVRAAISGFTLRVTIPHGLTPGTYQVSPRVNGRVPDLIVLGEVREMTWTVDEAVAPGTRFEYQIDTTVDPTVVDRTLECQAEVVVAGEGDARVAGSEVATVAVQAKGKYLDYLPALFEHDELMGRFLMLFESFWAPIEGQIAGIDRYFDPRMAPADLLPWLASMVDLTLDERWPEAKRRELLRSAVRLYRKRGTRRGLEEFLEIYAGVKPQIAESRARNFLLGSGSEAVLGSGIALGTANQPHTFVVRLQLPPAEGDDEASQARAEATRRRLIESIIEMEKPVHTGYTLKIETLRAED